ncbi:Ig-like domain-containing protein [Photobacterium frigidiphilum]|nr:Ig-like domain-containing protein [Photobacterium frigidiphilum]
MSSSRFCKLLTLLVVIVATHFSHTSAATETIGFNDNRITYSSNLDTSLLPELFPIPYPEPSYVTSPETFIFEADGTNATHFDVAEMNIYSFGTAYTLDSGTQVVFKKADGSIITTLSVSGTSTIANGNGSSGGGSTLTSIFGSFTPVRQVARIEFTIATDNPGEQLANATFQNLVIDNVNSATADSSGILTAAGDVSEPVDIPTTALGSGNATNVFDFSIADGGNGDGLSLDVSQIDLNLSGSASTNFSKLRFNLSGCTTQSGIVPSGSVVSFTSAGISIAEGGNTTCTVAAYWNDNTGITDNQTFAISIDGDTDLTVDSDKTQMSGNNNAVSTGDMATTVSAAQLVFSTQPAGSTSGSTLTIQPVVTAQDAAGNTDSDFTELVKLTQADAENLSGDVDVAAISGTATFTDVAYTATADQQSFTLTANDEDGVGSDLSTVNANTVTSDVVATQLVFDTQPAPLSVQSGASQTLIIVPVVSAKNADGTVDTDYSLGITLAEVNGAGTANLSVTGDTDGSSSTVTISPSSGVATFSGMQLIYTSLGSSNESFNLQASASGLSIANSSQFTASVNAAPTDISLSSSSISQSSTATGGNVGTFSTTDTDASDSHSYSLVSSGTASNGTCSGNDGNNTSFQLNGSTLETALALSPGNYAICIQTNDGTTTFEKSLAVTVNDDVVPTIGAVSIPNTDHKVGDTVTATITVSSDSDDYTSGSGAISGTINGYTLGSLSKVSDTAYTATFTITDGGTDVAAGSDIAVSLTLADSSGNTSSAYTTGISQANDAIYANYPKVILGADTNTINEDGGISTLTASLSNSLNNQWPENITVNLAYLGTATVSTDYTKSDTILISAGSSSGSAAIMGVADTLYDAASAETVIVDISSVSVGSEDGTQQQTISITDAESAPTVSLSVGSDTVAENSGTSSITATLEHPSNEDVTVNLTYAGTATSGTDYASPSSSIIITGGTTTANAATGITGTDDGDEEGTETIIIDIIGVSGGGASENGIQQKTITISDDDDTTQPLITSISVPENSTYTAGDTLSFTVNTDENVTVSGSPSLTLIIGGTTKSAVYSSGSGTKALVFVYTVETGLNDDDGISVTSLSTSTNEIQDTAGNDLIATLNAVGSLANVLVDSVASAVTVVSATTGNGNYNEGDAINVTVSFDEAVTVMGTPRLLLDTGTTDRYANYISGSGSAALTFQYTVQAGDTTSDLDYTNTSALSLNSGTIKDSAGNDATLTLPSPGTANSLGASKAIAIDTTEPTITIGSDKPSLKAGETAALTFTLSEASSDFANGDITVVGGILSSFSGSGTSYSATFTPDSDRTAAATIDVAATTFIDSAGNDNTAATQLSLTLDTLLPTINITSDKPSLKADETATLTFTLSEASSDFANGDITVVGGILSSFSGSGTSYSAVFTPDSDRTAAATINVAANTFIDSAGNDNTAATQLSLTLDTLLPTITIGSDKLSLKAGETATLTFTLSEASSDFANGDITVVGGSLSGFSGSGTSYSVVFTPDSDRTAAATIDVAATTFIDSAGNDNTAATQLSISLDTLLPTITIGSDKPSLKADETATLTFTLSEASSDFANGDITVVGGSLSSFSGSGTSYSAVFTPDNDRTAAATIDVAANTFIDSAGNDNTAATQLSLTLDTLLPTIAIGSDKPSLKAGETAALTFILSEASSDFAIGDITVIGGSLSAFTGSGTSYSATFTPDSDRTAAATIDVAANTFIDSAGNGNTAATQLSISLDTLLPTITIGSDKSSLKAGETAALTFTLSEASSDFSNGDITVVGGSLSAFTGSGTSYSVVFTPDSDRTAAATINVAANSFIDSAGNDNTAATQLSISLDTLLPTIAIGSDKPSLKAGETAALTFTLSEASSDFANGDISVVGGSLSAFTGSGTSYSATFSPDSDRTAAATIDVAATTFIDSAGNDNTAATQLSISLDTLLPTITIGSDKPSLKADEIATLTFTLSEASSDFVEGDVTVVGGSLSSFSGSGTSYNATLTPLNDGAVTVTVSTGAFTDLSGNASLAAEQFTLQYDSLRPYIQSLTPDDDANNVLINASLVLGFNEDMVSGVGSLSIYDKAETSLLETISLSSSHVLIDGAQVTINPSTAFISTHSYYVNFSSDALLDMAGNTFAGISDTTTYNFTIGNNVPILTDDTQSVAEDNSVAIAVLDNDSDSDSEINLASVTVTTQPTHGSTSVNTGTGVVTYVPDDDYSGIDTFYYRVDDVYGGQSVVAKVTITVTAVADDPVAVADVAATDEDEPIIVDVLANDTDSDTGDSMDSSTLIVVIQPLHGVATVESGQILYEPEIDYTGSDVFSYTVRDSTGRLSNSAEVRVNIAGINDAPVALADNAVTDEDTMVEIAVLLNDSDIDGFVDITTVAVVRQPVEGTIGVSELGVVSYTPEANVHGTDSFTYIVKDNEDATSEEVTVDVIINSVNDAPVANDDIATLLEDSTHAINVLGNDNDIDGQLDFSSVSVISPPSQGSVSVAGNGTISFTPATNFSGEDNFTYQVSDELSKLSNTAKVTITVQQVNDVPLANDDRVITTEDNAITINVIANDSDVDGTLDTTALTIDSAPTSGVLINNGDGTLVYTPNENSQGSDNFTYTIRDNENALSNSAQVSITIEAVNDVPTLSGTPNTEIAQGESYSFIPQANDVDEDTLTFSITNRPAWLTFDESSGVLSGTANNADVGTYLNIEMSVSDGQETAALPAFAITVTNVNDAPTITGSPSTHVNEDETYTFTPQVDDIDTNDALSFSIINKPSWANFDVSTGTLSGTPTNNDVGLVSNIVISATDGEESVALPTFSITVSNVNDAPIAENLSVNVNEDSSITIEPNLEDVDSATLSLLTMTQPQHGSLESTDNGQRWIYTPYVNYYGNDVFSYQVTDGKSSSATYTVDLAIAAVNDSPVTSDDSYVMEGNSSGSYSLDVLSNDSDVDNDSLRLDWVSATWGIVTIINDRVLFSAKQNGTVTLRYNVIDGNGGSDIGLVRLTIESSALQGPQITPPEDVELNANALFTKVALGVAKAYDNSGKALPISLVNSQTFFQPGNNIAYWRTEDSQGNIAEASQKVTVHPLVEIEKNSDTTEGTSHKVHVYLNGLSPRYPVVIPYTVSGSSDDSDHDLRDGSVVIESGRVGEIQFTIFDDLEDEGQESLTITLESTSNLGSKNTHTLSILEQNIAPKVAISVSQQSEQRQLIESSDKDVTILTEVTDSNVGDSHDYLWSSQEPLLVNTSTESKQYIFSPELLTSGIYVLNLKVTDDAVESLSVSTDIYIEVVEQLAVLGAEDTDGDLIPDNQEGFSDSDLDGIPDYQDAISECNVMQEQAIESGRYLVEGEPGVCLRKGNTISGNETGGIQLLDSEIATKLSADKEAENIGGVFDFIAYGLPQVGQSYQVVFPQRLPIPANAVYRKFKKESGWIDFTIDQFNYLSSSEGESGYCPPPGDHTWVRGLTEGYWCVQVTIQDGGPNDDDSIANGTVVDPGGVAVRASGNTLPIAQNDTATISLNSSVHIDVLSNDSDADGDLVNIVNVSADFGTVDISNNQLFYTTEDEFYGVATVSYSITDNNGGTAFANVTVNVVNSLTPIAVDDQAETDDQTALIINVLSNDTDPDGDSLTVISATAQEGGVIINSDQTLTYTPLAGYEGVDAITYRIRDDSGLEALAVVKVQITLKRSGVIENSAGGSVGGGGILLLLLLVLTRRYGRKIGLGLLALISFNSQANWFIETDLGYSNAHERSDVKASSVTNSDGTDFFWSIGVGYSLNAKWELVARYIDQGKGSATINDSMVADESHQDVAKITPVLVSGVGIDVSYSFWQADTFTVNATVGGMYWKTDFESCLCDSAVQGSTIKQSDDGIDPYLGFDIESEISENWMVGLGVTRYFIDANDVDSIALKLKYRFSQ